MLRLTIYFVAILIGICVPAFGTNLIADNRQITASGLSYRYPPDPVGSDPTKTFTVYKSPQYGNPFSVVENGFAGSGQFFCSADVEQDSSMLFIHDSLAKVTATGRVSVRSRGAVGNLYDHHMTAAASSLVDIQFQLISDEPYDLKVHLEGDLGNCYNFERLLLNDSHYDIGQSVATIKLLDESGNIVLSNSGNHSNVIDRSYHGVLSIGIYRLIVEAKNNFPDCYSGLDIESRSASYNVDLSFTAVPEPTTLLLLGLGIGLLKRHRI